MTNLIHKSFDLDIKSDSDGGFTAYVARFGNLDRTKEIIEPGAFKNLSDFSVDGWVGLNHDMGALPVATIDSVKQDSTGLLVAATWHTTTAAQECRAVVTERLKRGKSVKCSIGYRVLESYKDSYDGQPITRLKSLEIFEASIVNLPANPAADVVSAKSQEGVPMDSKILTLDALKSWLDAETKAGRVLSRANHEQLKCWHKSLSGMCDEIKSMIDAHDPSRDHGEPDGDEGKGVTPTSAGDGAESPAAQLAAGKSLEKLRAASVRARLSLLQPSIS